MPAPPEGFRPKCTRCGSERVEFVPVCPDCPEADRPAASEVTRAAEHIAGQDAGWKDYNATNRASVTCARAILAGQGAGLTEEERVTVATARARWESVLDSMSSGTAERIRQSPDPTHLIEAAPCLLAIIDRLTGAK